MSMATRLGGVIKKEVYSPQEKRAFLKQLITIITPEIENSEKIIGILSELIDDITLEELLVNGITEITHTCSSIFKDPVTNISVETDRNILKYFI